MYNEWFPTKLCKNGHLGEYRSKQKLVISSERKAKFTLQDFKPNLCLICKSLSSPTGQGVIACKSRGISGRWTLANLLVWKRHI